MRVAVAGATGTIGQAVVRALVADGHAVMPIVRAGRKDTQPITGNSSIAVDYADPDALAAIMREQQVETVISCIASRSGAPKDAQAVDYEANRNLLHASEQAGAGHFILLSAICVQRPKLAFQRAKLAFEAELKAARASVQPIYDEWIKSTPNGAQKLEALEKILTEIRAGS